MPKEITDSHASDRTKAFDFLHEVIDITAAHVCAYKIQKAFFDIFENGDRLLLDTIKYIKKRHAQIPIIIDSKIGDTSNTMKAYMDLIFSKLGADAVVVNPYMGDDVLAPFRNMENNAAIVLVKTSNKGGDIVQNTITATGVPLWIYVMELVVRRWNTSRNVMPVISSTESIDFSSIRKIIPDDMPILLAGFGAQGGKITKAHELLDSHKKGLVVNSSRAILYPYKTNDKNWRREIENAVIEMKRKINEIR
jgi:orotidine-5'-phosphate decarboxylase